MRRPGVRLIPSLAARTASLKRERRGELKKKKKKGELPIRGDVSALLQRGALMGGELTPSKAASQIQKKRRKGRGASRTKRPTNLWRKEPPQAARGGVWGTTRAYRKNDSKKQPEKADVRPPPKESAERSRRESTHGETLSEFGLGSPNPKKKKPKKKRRLKPEIEEIVSEGVIESFRRHLWRKRGDRERGY